MISRSRPRRNRYVQILLFIIIYSSYYAYSAVTTLPETSENDYSATYEPTVTSESSEVFAANLYKFKVNL